MMVIALKKISFSMISLLVYIMGDKLKLIYILKIDKAINEFNLRCHLSENALCR